MVQTSFCRTILVTKKDDDDDDNEGHSTLGESLVPNEASSLYGLCVCVCVCHCNSMLGTPGWRADKTHPAMGINVPSRCRCILVYNYTGAHCVVHPP